MMLRARNFGAVEVKLARDAVHQPLHREHRLRPPGAAHHRGRHAVGQRHRAFDPVGRNHVGPRQGGRRDERHDDAPRQIGAGVVQHGGAQAQYLAVAIDGDRNRPVLVALLRRGEEVLAAVLLPFHRPAKLHRRGRDHRLLGVERRLGAEAASDQRRDHADRFEIALEQVGERAAAQMRRLRRRPHREHVAGRSCSPAPPGLRASWRRRDAAPSFPRTHAPRS